MKLITIFFLYFTLTFFNSVLYANEREGPGLAIEGGSYKPLYDDAEKDIESSNFYGVSFDYQWDISHSFTFSLMGFEHGGKSNLPPKQDYEYYKSGFLGVGIKVWINSFFIDIHTGEYYLTWIETLSSYTGISQTGGNGFGLGIETKSGIIIAAFNEKSGVLKSDDMPNQRVEGNRLLLGYRWH